MIDLTSTHKTIIERRSQGVPDDIIRKWCGLTESQFMDASAHIAGYLTAKIKPVRTPKEPDFRGMKSAVYRAVCKTKEFQATSEIAADVGIPTSAATSLLRELKKDGLVTSVSRYAAKRCLWRAV